MEQYNFSPKNQEILDEYAKKFPETGEIEEATQKKDSSLAEDAKSFGKKIIGAGAVAAAAFGASPDMQAQENVATVNPAHSVTQTFEKTQDDLSDAAKPFEQKKNMETHEISYDHVFEVNEDRTTISVEITQSDKITETIDVKDLSQEEQQEIKNITEGASDYLELEKKQVKEVKETKEKIEIISLDHRYTIENYRASNEYGAVLVLKSTHAQYDTYQNTLDHLRRYFENGNIKTLDTQGDNSIRIKVLDVDGETLLEKHYVKNRPDFKPKSVKVKEMFEKKAL